MEGPNGHHHERSCTGPHGLRTCQKLQIPFEDVKDLFMRVMDMRRRRCRMGSHFKFSNAQRSPCMCPVLLDNHVNRTERKRASFSRLQYHSTHVKILSFLACSNKQQYKHLSRTWRHYQNRRRDEIFRAVLTRCELHHRCPVTSSQGEACS